MVVVYSNVVRRLELLRLADARSPFKNLKTRGISITFVKERNARFTRGSGIEDPVFLNS